MAAVTREMEKYILGLKLIDMKILCLHHLKQGKLSVFVEELIAAYGETWSFNLLFTFFVRFLTYLNYIINISLTLF